MALIKGEGTTFEGQGVNSLSISYENAEVEITHTASTTKTFRPSDIPGGWTVSVEYYWDGATALPTMGTSADYDIVFGAAYEGTFNMFCVSIELGGLGVDENATVSCEFRGNGAFPTITAVA